MISRSTKADIESLKREAAIHKLRLRDNMKRGRQVIIESHVGYIMGRYNANSTTYQYATKTDRWSEILSASVIVCKNPVFEGILYEKGYTYLISKVFYRITRTEIGIGSGRFTCYIDRVQLTKPNHYEMLCAVVNNI